MSLKPVLLLGMVLLPLAACGNGRTDVTALSIAKSYVSPQVEPVVQDPARVAQAVTEALTVLDGPVALATFEKTKNNVVLRQIETNGPYRTWTSWGSGERRSVTTKNGVITATRGLRMDLMSSHIDGSLALIVARKEGTAPRVQRYLNGDNQIEELSLQCRISRSGEKRVQSGEIDRMAVEMTEVCEGENRSIRNLYRVDNTGRVLQSVQWLNDFYGATVIQALR